MPNHCANRITISGPQKELDKCLEKIKSHDKVIDLQAFFPMPEELRGTESSGRQAKSSDAKKLKAKYGASDWYDWAHKNWGTKWGTYETSVEETLPGKVSIRYQTAWAPLDEGVFMKLSDMFPGLTFEEDYAEQGMGFGGSRSYKKGELTESEEVNSDDDSWLKVKADGSEDPATQKEIDDEDYSVKWVGDERYEDLFACSG